MTTPDHTLDCLIVDDEPMATQLLSDYVAQTPGLSLAAAFSDPIRALQYLREHSVDLILLDVQMPELNGIQFAKIVGKEAAIILTTAYESYALQGYDLQIVDYLLKPIAYPRFVQAVDRARKLRHPPAGEPETDTAPDFIFVKCGNRTLRIDLDELLYLTGSGDYVTLYLTGRRKELTLENLGDFAERLPGRRFCRIHRSHIVALDKIEFIERQRVVIAGEWLPISKSYQDAFWALVEDRKGGGK